MPQLSKPAFKLNQAVSLAEFRLLTDWIHRMNNQRIYRDDLSDKTLADMYSTIGKIRLIRCHTSFHSLATDFTGKNHLINLKIGVNPIYKKPDELLGISSACQANKSLHYGMSKEKLNLSTDYYKNLRLIPGTEELSEWVKDDEAYTNILNNPTPIHRIPLFTKTIPLDQFIPINKFNELVAWIHRIRDLTQTPEDTAPERLKEMYQLIGKIRIGILINIYQYSTGNYIDGRSPKGNMLVGAHKEYANPQTLFNLWQQNTNDVLFNIVNDFSLKYWDLKSIIQNLPEETEIKSWASYFDLTIQRKLSIDGIIVSYKDVKAELNSTIADCLNRIKLLEHDKHINPKVLEEARRLANTLSMATNEYLQSITDYTENKGKPQKIFIDKCTDAIHKAKPLLEKELGWGDYLTNLLKTLANALIHVTNFLTGSKCTLFTYATTPLVAEFEEVKESLKSSLAGSQYNTNK
ncbi:hypothetical protein [Legionella quateirensis]|uniref:Chaperone protein DnaJ 1 n=1 Tax=Legionella quateirensis TaxID=45072 RepID=A0A378KSI1_9GAMM|nr:hypothetical protein [Legionella quateirensis]KTD50920.1 substrate of the Dot/Icm secretion system [Legionella quateirensis]STY17834.1 Chaperone protein DnaJ 1 [Legionella quateirensis]